MKRKHLPREIRRYVKVEAGYMCAIPACKATPVEIAHIIPLAKNGDDSQDNLIALCPTCHRRYDKGEIDRKAIRAYKKRLVTLNHIADRECLSENLLHELTQTSLKNNKLTDDDKLRIDRQLDHTLEATSVRGAIFVVAESGLGKSVACYKRLRTHIEKGGFGLVIQDSTIAEKQSLELAIDKTLRDLHPSLAVGAGKEALNLASVHLPLLLVVEDVNRSDQRSAIIEKLVRWCPPRREEDAVTWQLLCPVRLQVLTELDDQVRRKVNRLAVSASVFSAKEGAKAVQRRWKHAGIPISNLEAEDVASALGQDPLLIALHDPAAAPSPRNTIEAFIDGSLGRLAARRERFTPGEYRHALRFLAAKMLEMRCLDVSMSEVASWFYTACNTEEILRQIVHSGEIIRTSDSVSDERLQFRHDRIREWLLSDAARDLFCRESMPEDVVQDPYFADIIGAALVCGDVPLSAAEHVKIANPLALFYAMRGFRMPANDLHLAVLRAAETWLDTDSTHGDSNTSLRWSACKVLSETDAEYVPALVKRFRIESRVAWGIRGSFRNGDLEAGIRLYSQIGLDSSVIMHCELINHVRRHKSSTLIPDLDKALRSDFLSDQERSGALRLAGYLGTQALAGAIEASWMSDSGRNARLKDYLWAGAQCCDDDIAKLLDPICDSWEALPEKAKDGYSGPSRNNLAAYEIRFAFQEMPPMRAIAYFIERARSSKLRWPITFMLHGVDHPDVITFLVHESSGYAWNPSPLPSRIESTWRWRQKGTRRTMSNASRDQLHKIWTNRQNGLELRSIALRLWSITSKEGDVAILQTVLPDDDLGNQALFIRLQRGDRTAKSGLIEKLPTDGDGFWWKAGLHIWSGELTQCLDEVLGKRSDSVGGTWKSIGSNLLDQHLSECLMELPTNTGEELLLKHWNHLSFSSCYLQAALYIATPSLAQIAATTIAECPKPKVLLGLIALHFGIKVKGRKGVTRITQIEGLLPYINYLGDIDLRKFWQECNRQGWYEFRRKHLDALVESDYTDDDRAMASLDKAFLNGHTGTTSHFGLQWADKFLETGVSDDHVMGIVQSWLVKQKDAKALQLAADIVVHCGRRCHLDVLYKHSFEATDHVRSIIANASFALKRRSLN